jgi:DNA-binding NtrC family response regulator
MALAFLQRLFGKRGSDGGSLSIGDAAKSLVKPEMPSTDVANPEDRKPLEPGPADIRITTNLNSLFAFVDPKDPFTPGEIAGHHLPGPILSIMSAKQFRHLFLFHTPHTREHAVATEKEVSSRYPKCQTFVHELPVSDPKDYSSVMGSLVGTVQTLIELRSSEIANCCYVCASSCTAEMRAAWFLLAALGVLPAKMLEVGSPARPLFGEANVKEVRMDSSYWLTLLEHSMRNQYFRAGAGELVGRVPLHKKPEAGQETIGFDRAFVERMRMLYGEPLTEFLLPLLHNKLMSRNLSPDWVQTLTDETLRSIYYLSRAVLFFRLKPKQFTDFVNSCFAQVLQKYYGRPENQDSPYELVDLSRELKLTQQQLDAILPGLPGEAPFGEEKEAFVRTGSRGPQTLESKNEAMEEAPREEPVAEPGEETKEIVLDRDRRLETPESQDGRTETAPDRAVGKGPDEAAKRVPTAGEEEYELFGEPRRLKSVRLGEPSAQVARAIVAREILATPGLDDALLELGIVVGSASLRLAAQQAGIAAGTHLPVLLLGETGTGKERFAHLIHRLSPRFHRELVPVNCAAIPASLAESYLLGHMKGAFTGATSDGKGIFEAANQSTLFLDEIAELTMEVQAKLLRVIQDGVVQRLGSTVPRRVDVRIIAASNRDLRKEVSAGRFRQDLYFRLEVVQINLPALRERRAEIPELALMLLRQINQRTQEPHQLTTGALARLEGQPWPGNVRDLLNVLERSVLYSRADVLDAEDLIITCDPPGQDPFAALPQPSVGFKVEEYLRQARNQLFLRALEACKGNQTAAAELLGVSKQAVNKFVSGQDDNEN